MCFRSALVTWQHNQAVWWKVAVATFAVCTALFVSVATGLTNAPFLNGDEFRFSYNHLVILALVAALLYNMRRPYHSDPQASKIAVADMQRQAKPDQPNRTNGPQPDQSANDSNALDAEQRFSLVLKTFNIATFYCDLEHRYIWSHNFVGNPLDILGKTDREILPSEAAEKLYSLKAKALEDGGMHSADVSINIGYEEKTYAIQVAPRRDSLGNVIGTIAVSCDVTEKVVWQKQLLLMMREVNHRARNLLTIISSVCARSAKNCVNVEQYKEKIIGRVMSLSSSMDLITECNWEVVSLKKLLTSQFNVLPLAKSKKLKISGSDFLIRADAAQNLGLVVHELATNALQYGAFSTDAGHIEITLSPGRDSNKHGLVMTWREHVGQSISSPQNLGFGLNGIARIMECENGGACTFDWNEDGLVCELHLTKESLGSGYEGHVGEGSGKCNSSETMRESLTGEEVVLG